MPTNKAAWLLTPCSRLTIADAPYPTTLSPSSILIRTAAVAINPLDVKTQDFDVLKYTYPTIIGSDVAGTVIAVGDDVPSHIRVGAKVCAHVHGMFTGKLEGSGFQEFVVIAAREAVVVPDEMPLEKAVVLPLGCTTAAAGLFVPGQLGLETGSLGGESGGKRGVVLIWGGSSSVGCCAIQTATAAGYEVVATASARNHALCRELGAVAVVDYNAPDCEEQIVKTFEGKTSAGALDCIGENDKTVPACARVLAKVAGVKKILSVMTVTQTEFDGGVTARRVMIPEFIPHKVFDTFTTWMIRALADGSLRPKPEPKIVGHGMEYIQEGIDVLRQGVSATKVVVRIGD